MLDLLNDHDLQDIGIDDPALRERIIVLVRRQLSALASKGVDGMPSVSECAFAYHAKAPAGSALSADGAHAVLGLVRSRLAPILAAKDAECDALRARVAELESQLGIAARPIGIPDEPQPPPPPSASCTDQRMIGVTNPPPPPPPPGAVAECTHPRWAKRYGPDGNSWTCGHCGAWQGERES